MKRFFKSLLGLFLCLTSFTSCGTLCSIGSHKILIDGDVSEPVTIKTEKKLYSDVTLPVRVRIKRYHVKGQKITITSENNLYPELVMDTRTNYWVFGNIIGLIGLGVDAATGSLALPAVGSYYIAPISPKGKTDDK